MRNPLADALSGVTVLDFTVNIAGPYATMILADLGADVIKVERAGRGDDTRHMSPVMDGTSAAFQAINRGKRSVALDLKSPSGRDTALRLGSDVDIIIESFRPGVMDRLGLGYQNFARNNSSLLYCSISGFGEEGLGRARGAYDPLIQAFSGLMSLTGEKDGAPVRSGASISDVSTGMWAATGLLAALRTPPEERPLHLQVSLLDSVMAFLMPQIAATLATGSDLPRMGSASPLMAPYQVFETKDGGVMVAAGNDSLYERLLKVLGAGSLAADERFTTMPGRVRNMTALVGLLRDYFLTRTTEDWISRLSLAGVPAAPVNNLSEVLEDPLVKERGVLHQVDGSVQTVVTLPLRVDAQPIQPGRGAPSLDEHGEEVARG